MDKSRFNIHLTDEAKENYQQIKHYLIKELGIQVFIVLSEKLLGTMALIEANPYLFPLFDDNRDIRRGAVRKEVSIFYEIKENEVMILSIFDYRRNTPDF